MNHKRIVSYFIFGAIAAALTAGCGCSSGSEGSSTTTGGSTPTATTTGSGTTAALKGDITGDGSSTVGPISEAMAEEYNKKQPDVKVAIGISGTGGGFKKLIAGEIDFAGASRPIDAKELEALKKAGFEVVELPIGYDGLTVVVNPQNNFVDKLTVAELKKIWEPNSTAKTWADVRAGWPAEKIKLYCPGTDSGTFDYFTEAIMGKKGAQRTDVTASENDNVLVQGVAGDKFSIGYFGHAYAQENASKLKLVPIDNNNGKAIAATHETIADGSYQPLSRPLFVYASKKALDAKPELTDFLKFYLGEGLPLVEEVGYVKLPDEAYTLANQRLTDKKTGTTFHGAEVGVTVVDLLKKEPHN